MSVFGVRCSMGEPRTGVRGCRAWRDCLTRSREGSWVASDFFFATDLRIIASDCGGCRFVKRERDCGWPGRVEIRLDSVESTGPREAVAARRDLGAWMVLG